MKTILIINDPATTSERGLFQACEKLAVAVELVAEPIQRIGKFDQLHVQVIPDKSKHLHIAGFGYPLIVHFRINEKGGRIINEVYAKIYISKMGANVWAWIEKPSPKEFRGNIGTVFRELSVEAVEQLQKQFISASG
ncbi:MAG: hypothetical protein ACD_76C00148G0004 [uncultured bacterium]|nr:MAG: hypothetical protein ACD_76C00148G0004 [uncultured bacterium]HBD05708.1 hypothetical protein [Candidatus Uhrbacteria bacterium]